MWWFFLIVWFKDQIVDWWNDGCVRNYQPGQNYKPAGVSGRTKNGTIPVQPQRLVKHYILYNRRFRRIFVDEVGFVPSATITQFSQYVGRYWTLLKPDIRTFFINKIGNITILLERINLKTVQTFSSLTYQWSTEAGNDFPDVQFK